MQCRHGGAILFFFFFFWVPSMGSDHSGHSSGDHTGCQELTQMGPMQGKCKARCCAMAVAPVFWFWCLLEWGVRLCAQGRCRDRSDARDGTGVTASKAGISPAGPSL